MNRRGSAALTMLDSQSLEPRLESVLSSVNPPSEDAAYQVTLYFFIPFSGFAFVVC